MFALITSTIFIGIGLSEVYRLVQNTEMLGVPNPVPGRPIFIGDVIITKEQIWVFAGAILSSLIGLAIFGYARLGRGLRAMAANARGAAFCGYSTDGMNAMAWFLGGALAGLAGVFAAPSKGVSPELAISMITAGFVAAVDRRLRFAARRAVRRAHSRPRRDVCGRLCLERHDECGELSAAFRRAVMAARGPVPRGENPRCLASGRAPVTRVVAPSAALLAVGILGLLFDTYWQYVLAISISAAVIGGALAMLVGYARCITIATGAMMAIGAYGAAIPVVAGVPFLAALVFATALGALAGFILAIPGVRFRSHNLAMITLVFQSVVIIVLRESKTLTGGAEGINVPPPVIFGVSFADDAYFLLLCGLLCALAILPMAVLLAGPFGKNLRAIASNENAARAFGIDVRHHLIAAFTWSSALIAFAGAVSAPRFRIIDPDSYGVLTSIFALAYPIIGGMSSIWGGIVGGGVLRVLPELLRPVADYIELMFCVLVVGTLTFFPDGLASALWTRRRHRSPNAVAGAVSTREMQSARIAELFSATGSLAGPSAEREIVRAPDSRDSTTCPSPMARSVQWTAYRSRSQRVPFMG